MAHGARFGVAVVAGGGAAGAAEAPDRSTRVATAGPTGAAPGSAMCLACAADPGLAPREWARVGGCAKHASGAGASARLARKRVSWSDEQDGGAASKQAKGAGSSGGNCYTSINSARDSSSSSSICSSNITGSANTPSRDSGGMAGASGGSRRRLGARTLSVETSQLRDAAAAAASLPLSPKELSAQHLVAQGTRVLEELSDEEDAVSQAAALLSLAAADAREAGNAYLEARALCAMASAFLLCPERKDAAAPLFELAADLFIETGQRSDAISCVINVAECHQRSGGVEQAISCYERYDRRLASDGLFADRIAMLVVAPPAAQRSAQV
jgi:hypothetical protein